MNNLFKVALTIKADTDQAKASINALNNAFGKSRSAAAGAAQGLVNLVMRSLGDTRCPGLCPRAADG